MFYLLKVELFKIKINRPFQTLELFETVHILSRLQVTEAMAMKNFKLI